MDRMTGRLEALTEDECRWLLACTKVGRVSVTYDALPVIATVNYVLDSNTIVFRTRSDGMLARACKDAVIAFEIDELAGDGSGGWSVNIVGIATVLDAGENVRAMSLGLVSAAGDDRDTFVRLRLGLISGRRITPLGATATPA